jgi:Peptidase family M41
MEDSPAMAITIDKQLVRERQGRLDEARSELKKFFVGIDGMIDELCDAIAVWYTMPEVLSRPAIVNLWGMTGVGKTDLVRRLVAHLDMQEHFVEIELTNSDTTTWHSSVASRLAESGALEGRPALLLFDEIQRFNTIDSDGKPLPTTKFSDFWELLSDGRLARRDTETEWLFADISGSVRSRQRQRDKGEEVGEDRIGIWEARSIKKAFGLADALEDLSEMSYEDTLRLMQAARAEKKIYEPIDCSKCLLIISGNLDEAFTMARETAENDVDADIFQAFTSKITTVDIKNALITRFKPEQVARFGNTHLIYRSLLRQDFEELIRREVRRVQRTTQEAFGIDLVIDASIERLIYRNGVFPVQGVRPVFSSVADILESNLAKLLAIALMTDAESIAMRYDEIGRRLVTDIGGEEHLQPYSGRIDKIRNDALDDKVANVAVHEAGHAVAYAVLFGLAPLQLTARVASTYVGGFTFPHQIYETSASLLDQVKVLLAGGLAEEVIFGPELASVGRNSDRERATEIVIDFVRRYGFDREFQANYMLDLSYAMDRTVPEPDIEKLMTRLAAETTELLGHQRPALVALAALLADRGSLPSDEVAAIMTAHGIDTATRPEGFQWLPEYQRLLAEP